MATDRDPLDPTRTFSEGGGPEHRAALGIDCPACGAKAGAWCPMPGTTWNLCGARIHAANAMAPKESGRPCEDCGVPGGEVAVKRQGVVVWQRVLCDWCFEARRRNTEAQYGVRIAVVGQA